MGREPKDTPVQILHIGLVDSNHEHLWQQLQREGIKVAFALTQGTGLQMIRELQPLVVVIDTTTSHFSGDRLCRTLGRRLPGAQRLLIVGRGTEETAPCEKRIVRPFTIRKLREALFELLNGAPPRTLEVGPVRLDLISQVVMGPNGQQHLTPKLCTLLTIFMQHPNQAISRKDLMARIWGAGYLNDTRTLDVHIRWLREKIEPDPADPSLLLTRRGIGYIFAIPELENLSGDSSDEID